MSDFASVDKYPFTIRPLSIEDGGGYLIEYPDLPGCHSDGDTPEQAIVNGRDAVRSYLMSCRKHGDPIPKPRSLSSGQFRVRMPKTLHARLVAQAEREGVSLNMLVVAAAAQVLGQRERIAPKKKGRRRAA